MKEEKFDNFFKNRLSNYESPIPDELWGKIRPNERRKTFLFYKWLAAFTLALFVLGGGYWYFLPSGKSKTNKTGKVTNRKNLTQNDSLHLKKSLQHHTTTIRFQNNSHLSLTQKKLLKEETTIHPATNTFSFLPHKAEMIALPFSSFEIRHITNTNLNELFEQQHSLLLPSVSGKYITKEKTFSQLSENNSNTGKQQQKTKKATPFYIEWYAAPQWLWEETWNYTNQSYNYSLAANEEKRFSLQPRLSFATGIGITKPFSKHWSLKSGVHYSQVNEKYTYSQYPYARTVTSISQRDITVDNQPVIISDTAQYIQIGLEQRSGYNRYRSFHIPLLLSYTTEKDKNFSFAAHAGVMINVYNFYSGETMNKNAEIVPIKSDHYYKHHTGLGIYVGLRAEKKIQENIRLFAEPYWNAGFSNSTTSQTQYNRKLQTGGVAIGIQYKWQKKQATPQKNKVSNSIQ
jgi:hypothetical protein